MGRPVVEVAALVVAVVAAGVGAFRATFIPVNKPLLLLVVVVAVVGVGTRGDKGSGDFAAPAVGAVEGVGADRPLSDASSSVSIEASKEGDGDELCPNKFIPDHWRTFT